MPWNLIVTGGALVLLLAAWLFRRRQPSSIGPMPDVGQPPEDAEPMVEPRLQDIGSATYELPLSPPDAEPPDAEPPDAEPPDAESPAEPDAERDRQPD